MPPKVEQATIIVLDIGRNAAISENKNSKNFFENAIECTARIIERKIMSQGKDLIAVILLGSKKTKNNVAEQCPGSFKHIELFIELEVPSWKMIRELPETPTKTKGDWFDALIVAVDYFKNIFSGTKIANKRIILMTNFGAPSDVNDSDFEKALDGLKEEQFQVDVIGCDIYTDEDKNSDINLVRQLVEGTNGVTAPFEDTMRYLLFHKKKHVNAVPWNVDLCIGPNIKIPISSYVRLKDQSIVKKWSKAIKDPITGTASTSEAILKNKIHINTEDRTILDSKDLIKGYHYGQEIIPFTDCDASMIYEPGQKSLLVYGFTNASNIKWQHLNGDGLSYVFGRKGDKKAQLAIKCLVQCLHELNLVGIVRRVYNNGNAPRMYALMPVLDTNDFVCLSMLGICFKEEIKNMAFPPTNLKKYSCSDEQVNTFKDLINSMDLTKAYDDSEFDDNEAFPIAETISPTAQYVLDSIAFRAMNPGKPLPPPRDDLMMLFKVPPLIEERARVPLEKLKTLFVLNKVEVKKRDKIKNEDIKSDANSSMPEKTNYLNNDVPKVHMPIKETNIVSKIGTIDPINDYKKLLSTGKSLNDLATELKNAIESLFYSNFDGNYYKALDSMKFYRNECIKGDPSHYNNWLQNLKMELIDRKKSDIVDLFSKNKLSYILKHENNLSTYDFEESYEDSEIYENDTVPNLTEINVSSEVNDFFDNM